MFCVIISFQEKIDKLRLTFFCIIQIKAEKSGCLETRRHRTRRLGLENRTTTLGVDKKAFYIEIEIIYPTCLYTALGGPSQSFAKSIEYTQTRYLIQPINRSGVVSGIDSTRLPTLAAC